MADKDLNYNDKSLVSINIGFTGSGDLTTVMEQLTPMEIILGESLLTPGLQTAVRFHSALHHLGVRSKSPKNLDALKGSLVSIQLEKESLGEFGISTKMTVNQPVYRMDRRHLYNNNTEDFTIHACHQTLLDDAATLVSKSWKCTTPSSVVSEVLSSCAGAKNLDIQSSMPARDYIAENIHPFQVVTQQANAALDGNDPSFVHYMTYKIDDGDGTHHFRSLKNLTSQSNLFGGKAFNFQETGSSAGYAYPFGITTHSFPCDFDLLTDLLNGVNQNISVIALNPLKGMISLLGNQTIGCGAGAGVLKSILTNAGSASQQNACEDQSAKYAQLRQARMSLIDQNRIALRMTVPWNPDLHAGKMIRLELWNKTAADNGNLVPNYGTGDYLIVSMTHNIKYGGYGTTTVDCVSRSIGEGVV
jgi:hypothetical protein